MVLDLLLISHVISVFQPSSESATEIGFAKRRNCISRKIKETKLWNVQMGTNLSTMKELRRFQMGRDRKSTLMGIQFGYSGYKMMGYGYESKCQCLVEK